MGIDKFGRSHITNKTGKSDSSSSSGNRARVLRGPPGIGFKLTESGDFDLDNKRLTNVGSPISENDCVTKFYVLSTLSENITQLRNCLNKANEDNNSNFKDLRNTNNVFRNKFSTIDEFVNNVSTAITNIEKVINLINNKMNNEVTEMSKTINYLNTTKLKNIKEQIKKLEEYVKNNTSIIEKRIDGIDKFIVKLPQNLSKSNEIMKESQNQFIETTIDNAINVKLKEPIIEKLMKIQKSTIDSHTANSNEIQKLQKRLESFEKKYLEITSSIQQYLPEPSTTTSSSSSSGPLKILLPIESGQMEV